MSTFSYSRCAFQFGVGNSVGAAHLGLAKRETRLYLHRLHHRTVAWTIRRGRSLEAATQIPNLRLNRIFPSRLQTNPRFNTQNRYDVVCVVPLIMSGWAQRPTFKCHQERITTTCLHSERIVPPTKSAEQKVTVFIAPEKRKSKSLSFWNPRWMAWVCVDGWNLARSHCECHWLRWLCGSW